jgi:hypothetical protein
MITECDDCGAVEPRTSNKSEVEVQPSRVSGAGLAAVQIAEQDAVLILGSFRLWFGPERRQELAELCAEKMREWESEG